MRIVSRAGWLRSGLFWRTFFLLSLLLTTSMAVWYASSRSIERTPRAKQMAAQVVSIVTITQAALTHSAPESRIALLLQLKQDEGLKVYPLERTDTLVPLEMDALNRSMSELVKRRLGSDTQFARSVNGQEGFWVSFDIEGDRYWIMLDRERVEHGYGMEWLGWALFTLILSLVGAVFITRLINLPLARLTDVAMAVARGRRPPELPEKGPAEIREANRSFNQMVSDLERVDSDRALVLAGISHDLRTPLARMLLEVEMANLSAEARAGMQSDLAQMDAIIGQFLDYSKPSDNASFETIDLTNLLHDVVQGAERLPDVTIQHSINPGLTVQGNPVELRRVFNNLIENARRYAKSPATGETQLDIDARIHGERVVVKFRDQGPGVPEDQIERLLRPFVRLDSARGQANGAGLGLAIVDRILRRHGAKLRLRNRDQGGLSIDMAFPKND